jgi:hypothetical protein
MDILTYEGFEVRTPRETIRTSFIAGYLNEAEAQRHSIHSKSGICSATAMTRMLR